MTTTSAYFALGIEHILGGLDHLFFVVGATIMLGASRRLLWAITAFTAGHALTLGAHALGPVLVPTGPVEVAIAASVAAIAVEAFRARPVAPGRWLVGLAFAFGLVHGLGFAGALREVGLPATDALAAVASFNAGIEVGQLAAVGLVLGLGRLLGGRAPTAGRAAAGVMSAVAGVWLVDRLLAWLAAG
jgi:hypothetical protein